MFNGGYIDVERGIYCGGLVARAELLAANLDVTSGTINGGTTVKISGTGLPYKYVASTQNFGTDTCARLEVYDGTNP